MGDEIKVAFIIPIDCNSENECSEDMQLAFVACEQHCGGGLTAQWIKEKSWNFFTGLTKKDVFVMSQFEGELYDKLRTTKCLIVGPRCLSCCLTEGIPIPSGPEPIFTIAMKSLVITASGLTKQKKENIKKKVHWMGGLYSTVLTDDTTHLVSDTVLSDKYIKSVEKGIPVMSETWVEAVWEASMNMNINGSSSEFDSHKLPPFANLQVTTSGISKKDKHMIMKLVSEHGGSFSGAFQSETTDVVVLTKEGIGSEKYKAALEYGKACVLPSWVRDSAARGVSLPLTQYRVCGASTSSPLAEHRAPDMKWVRDSAARGVSLPLAQYRVCGASTSSPLAEHRAPDMSLNFSRITNLRPPSNFVDESRATDMSTLSGRMKLTQESSKKSNDSSSVDKEIIAAFENFDVSYIKKAGPIFDGFCIWVTGLEGTCREKAVACVSRGGGVRYDCPHERVTHAVAGSKAAALAAQRALPAVCVLSPLWLVNSVMAGQGRPLDEAEYLIDTKPTTPAKSSARKPKIEPASPMSKRNLQLLRRGPLDLPPPMPEVEEPVQDEIVNHYLSQNMPEPEPPREKTPEPAAPNVTVQQPDVTSDVTEQPTEEIEQIFRGIKIEVQGLDEEAICELGAEVGAAGGALAAAGAGGSHALVPMDFDPSELVTRDAEAVTVFWVSAAGAGGSHALVPMDFDPSELVTRDAEAVTVFWVKDCLSQQELLPIEYYHRPVQIPTWGDGPPPLNGVVASLSTYSGMERAFLDELAKLLGATTQLRFCRRNTANALASTHLICPTPTGDKYTGALKWGLPAVKASWLLECARTGKRVSEREYLVGDTKAPPSPQKTIEQMPPESKDETNSTTDKENDMRPPPTAAVPRRGSIPSREQTPKGKNMDKENDMRPPPTAAVPRRGSIPSREQTPKGKNMDVDDMSPASRYIAMARQGLLGGDSQETPKRIQALKDDARQDGEIRTPPLDDALSTPNLVGLSPTTRRRLQAVKRGEMPSDPIRTPKDLLNRNPDTPDSAFGAALRPGSGRLSPEARKRLWQVVQDLPSKEPQLSKERHTPLSEIRNRFLAQFNGDVATPPSEHHVAPRKLQLQEQADTPPAKMPKLSADQSAGSISSHVHEDEDSSKNSTSSASSTLPAAVDAQLNRLNAALSSRLSSQKARRTRDSFPVPVPPPIEVETGPESQPNTVGWDDTTPANNVQDAPVQTQATKRFMLSSNVDNREEIIEMIQYLGGEVCEGTELDPEATHLLCAAPGRSEKMLGSIAAGRWVLHPAYVARSRAGGGFLAEEDFEWGNPKATCLPPLSGAERTLARAAYRWRSGRERRMPGPFAGVVALLHVPAARRRLLARLVSAGDGIAPEDDMRDKVHWRSGRERRLPGPFAGVVALLHVPAARRRLLARLVSAGDGIAPEDEPPYNNEDITVCFADIKRYPLSDRDAAWLVSRRIPVCAPVLLSSYLTDEHPPNPVEHCLPDFRPK